MKLEPPLANLVRSCEKMCVAACCGIDAFDFSPIHIASFLLSHSGGLDDGEAAAVRNSLEAWRRAADVIARDGSTVAVEELNQMCSGEQLQDLVDTIAGNFEVALELIAVAESKRVVSRNRW